MYNETTPFIVSICNKKRVHEIFLKSKLQKMQLKISTSILAFRNYFLTCSALQTLIPPNLCLLLRLSQILNIFNVFFSTSRNRLNTVVIKNMYKSPMHTTWVLALFSSAVQQRYTQHHSITDKNSSFESRCYLILEVHNTLVRDPT